MVKKMILHLMIFSIMFMSAGVFAISANAVCPFKKHTTRVELFLKFNETQLEKYKAIKSQNCCKQTALKQSLMAEKKKLKELHAKNADPKDIKAQHEVVNGLKEQLATQHKKYVEELTAIMTPAQKEKFEKSKFVINDQGCFCKGNCGCKKGHPCPVS